MLRGDGNQPGSGFPLTKVGGLETNHPVKESETPRCCGSNERIGSFARSLCLIPPRAYHSVIPPASRHEARFSDNPSRSVEEVEDRPIHPYIAGKLIGEHFNPAKSLRTERKR